jgi:hypothetical protein
LRTKLAQIVVVSALVLAIGAHWGALQTIAWISMAVSYSQQSPLKEALLKTFDGRHPCRLCKVVQEGKKSEKTQQPYKPLTKLDLFFLSASLALRPPHFQPFSSGSQDIASAITAAPPKPPPRPVSA